MGIIHDWSLVRPKYSPAAIRNPRVNPATCLPRLGFHAAKFLAYPVFHITNPIRIRETEKKPQKATPPKTSPTMISING